MTFDSQELFERLAQSLRSMNDTFQQSAASAINKHVTCEYRIKLSDRILTN